MRPEKTSLTGQRQLALAGGALGDVGQPQPVRCRRGEVASADPDASALGTFLRTFTHGHVQQLNAVLRQMLNRRARHAPLLPGAQELVFLDLVRPAGRGRGVDGGTGHVGVSYVEVGAAPYEAPATVPHDFRRRPGFPRRPPNSSRTARRTS